MPPAFDSTASMSLTSAPAGPPHAQQHAHEIRRGGDQLSVGGLLGVVVVARASSIQMRQILRFPAWMVMSW